MSDATTIMEALNLSVGFEKRTVLENVSVQLTQSQVIAIAGPNGAGKSTLIKTMARQIKPISGSVKLNTTDIWSIRTQEFAGKVAYVPQDIESSTELTVEQMVMLGRNPHQKWWQWYGDSADTDAVKKALTNTEMERLKDKPICQLSGGERQRAALATALAQEPQFMLLDEPTSHLDFKHQNELLALLKRLRADGLGIMIVLHDLNVIARVADSVILIEHSQNEPSHNGESSSRSTNGSSSRVAATGTVEQALSIENLKRVFDVNVTAFNDPLTGEVVYNPFSLQKN
ncbi:MAG: ABC transporter ATP-binding protein [Cyanobacteria bacterium SZAS-4]|nr:ABC transporter ATP-binding protein [Cyanobacteria bacterium SZAS-4]